MKKLILLILIVCSHLANAQDWKRTQNWYFGDSAGLSFATDPPTVLTDGQMYALEGCATISDTAGNLLFYTNGLTVWNKNHEIMENGTGLFGFESSAQAALIIPQPGNDSIYFIFTNGAETILKPFGLHYSVVNIKKNGGLGGVIDKNILLVGLESEKLAATHGNGNNHFYTFMVTNQGVTYCPVISKAGSVMTGLANATEMRFSPSGQFAAVSFYSNGFVELLNFNNSTGIFSNPIKIITSPGLVTGLIFSPDERHLIISARERWIRSYNFESFNQSIINNSFINLYTGSDAYCQFQYSGPSPNMILLSWAGKNSIRAIQFDPTDSQVSFIDSAVSIGTRTGTYGMPQFISSYYYQPILDIAYQTNCYNDSVIFNTKSSQTLISPAWSIYKNGNLIHSETSSNFNYYFPDTGAYLVQLINDIDTVSKEIFIEPYIRFGGDTTLCNTNALILNIPNSLRCIQWQDGSDTTVYRITENGTYFVSAYNGKGCLLTDTLNVEFSTISKPEINRIGDRLETDSNTFIYQWFYNDNPIDSSNKHYLTAKQTGEYKVQIANSMGCTSASNPFNINSLTIQANNNLQFRIYPNPAKSGNEIMIESEEMIFDLVITDMLGKSVFKQGNINQNNYQIKIQNNYQIKIIEKGIYILNINNTRNYKLMIE